MAKARGLRARIYKWSILGISQIESNAWFRIQNKLPVYNQTSTSSQTKYIDITKGENFDVYQSTSENSRIVGTVKGGQAISVLETSGQFTKIDFNGRKGYIKTINISDTRNSLTGYVLVDNLKVYDAPSDLFVPIEMLQKGDKVEIIEYRIEHDSKYVRINYKGYGHAYVDRTCLGTTEPGTPTTPETQELKYIDITKGENFNVYQSASKNSTKVGTVKGGQSISVLGTSGQFTKIKFNGVQGYIETTNITNTKNSLTRYVAASSVKVYDAPSDLFVPITTLKQGTEVKVIEFMPEYNSKYVRISYAGYEHAYVDRTYLGTTKPGTTTQETSLGIRYVYKKVALLSGQGTGQTLATLNPGTKLELYSTTGTYVKVKDVSTGKVGYVDRGCLGVNKI